MSEIARTKEPIEIYTIPELCRALDVSDKTVSKILKSGDFDEEISLSYDRASVRKAWLTKLEAALQETVAYAR